MAGAVEAGFVGGFSRGELASTALAALPDNRGLFVTDAASLGAADRAVSPAGLSLGQITSASATAYTATPLDHGANPMASSPQIRRKE